jgi:hypothetical protein
MDAGTRIIGGVSAEFWISGFGAQPDNATKPLINKMTQSTWLRRVGEIEGRTASEPLLDLGRVFINTFSCMKNK